MGDDPGGGEGEGRGWFDVWWFDVWWFDVWGVWIGYRGD